MRLMSVSKRTRLDHSDGILTLAPSELRESLANFSRLVGEIDVGCEAVDACLGILRLLEEFRVPCRGRGVLGA